MNNFDYKKKTISIYLYSVIAGIFRDVRLHCRHLGHDLPVLHSRTLAVLRGQHICVGAVCVAHG